MRLGGVDARGLDGGLHLFFCGGGEDVGRRALCDLFDQLLRAGEIQHDACAGVCRFESARDFGERFAQRGGGEDREFGRARGAGGEEQEERGEEGERGEGRVERGEGAHGAIIELLLIRRRAQAAGGDEHGE